MESVVSSEWSYLNICMFTGALRQMCDILVTCVVQCVCVGVCVCMIWCKGAMMLQNNCMLIWCDL